MQHKHIDPVHQPVDEMTIVSHSGAVSAEGRIAILIQICDLYAITKQLGCESRGDLYEDVALIDPTMTELDKFDAFILHFNAKMGWSIPCTESAVPRVGNACHNGWAEHLIRLDEDEMDFLVMGFDVLTRNFTERQWLWMFEGTETWRRSAAEAALAQVCRTFEAWGICPPAPKVSDVTQTLAAGGDTSRGVVAGAAGGGTIGTSKNNSQNCSSCSARL